MRNPVLALVTAATLASVALAHPPAQTAVRELVRLQGHRGSSVVPPGAQLMVLTALGTDHPFVASDFRSFGFGEDPAAPPPTRLVLQARRDVLQQFAAARPEQTVTILAEHRPGSADVFVLALDLCPPR